MEAAASPHHSSGTPGSVQESYAQINVRKIKICVLLLAFPCIVNSAGFYYQWSGNPFINRVDACQASIDNINAGSGSDYAFDDVVWDKCPRGTNEHCASCQATRTSPYPDTITFPVSSVLKGFLTREPLDNNQPNMCTGNPIDPVTGNKLQYEQLIKLEATQPIVFDIFYNSSRLEHWRHSYSRNLSFSSHPNGNRIDYSNTPFDSKPIASPESPSNLGGIITNYGKPDTSPASATQATYSSEKDACELGWNTYKQYYHYSWAPASVAEYRLTPNPVSGTIGQCYILDSTGGVVKKIIDIFEKYSGQSPSYDNAASDSFYRFTRANGSVTTFSNFGVVKNTSSSGETVEVVGSGSTAVYKLHTNTDEIEEYTSDGKLQSITSAQGQIQTLSYDSDSGLLNEVKNQTGESLTFAYESYGDNNQYNRIKTITDHTSRIWTFEYDIATHNLIAINLPDASQRQYHYEDPNDSGLLTGISDETGQRFASWQYDANNRAIMSAHGGNKDIERVELNYLKYGQRTITKKRSTGLTGGTATDITSTYITHTGGGAPIVAEVTGNDAIQFEHDAITGYLQFEEKNGHRTEYKNYDSKGNPGTIREAVNSPVQREKQYTYDPRYHSKITSITEPSVIAGNNKVTSFQYDDFANNTAIATTGFRPDGTPVSRSTSFQYNGPYHQLTLIDGPRTDVNDVTTIQYYPDDPIEGSNRARMKNVFAPEGIALYSNISYTATGKMQSYLDENNVQVAMDYFAGNDRLKSLSQLDQNTGDTKLTEWTYLATGEVKTITTGSDLADKTTLTFNYDDGRRLTSIVDGLGNRIEYILDSEGNIEQQNYKDSSGALKKQLTQTFDDYNRLQLRTQVNEQYTETWLPDGTLDNSIDGNNVTTDYSYDNLKRLTQINQDMGGTSAQTADALTLFNYDAQDNLTYVKNPVNGETTYTYDDLGNQLTRNSDDTGLTVYSYDEAGNIITMTDANGETTSYTYDALNRLTSNTTANLNDNYSFEYDNCQNGVGRLCKVTGASSTQYYSYDAFGNITSQQALQYGYDSADRLNSITYPSGAIVTYQYDAASQIQNVLLARNGITTPLASSITYDPFGDMNNLLYGSGLSLSQSKDAAYRPLSQSILNIFQLDYTQYDANGNLTQRSDTIAGSTANYAYDAHDRLLTASGDFGTRSYAYDKNANSTSLTADGVQTSNNYQPQSNRLSMRGLDNAVLDNNGNTLSLGSRSYSYNKHNRLFEVFDNGILKATYQYNVLGQRISKTLPDGTGRYFLYDTDGKLMAETDIDGNVLFEYIYLNGQLLAKYNPDTDSDGISNAEEDIQGSNPVSPDKDNDGLSDLSEMFQYGTSANNADSDGDGIDDGQEITFNSNPLDSYVNIGDINQNGELNAGDYLLLVQYVLGTKTPSPTEQQQADVNQDGTLNVQDILLMQKVLLGQSLSWLDFSIDNAEQLFAQAYNSLLPPAWAAAGDGDLYYIHNDHLGTPVKMTDELGFVVWQAVYDPFGKATVDEDVDGDGKTVEMNVRFPGQYYDGESGLHYNYFRTYDPALGRYITSDPIGLKGGLNTYGYVFGRPTRFIDPLGLGPVSGGLCTAIDVGITLSGIHTTSNALAEAIQPLKDQQEVLDKRISQCEDPEKEIKLRELRQELSELIVDATREYALDNYTPADATIFGGAVAAGCLGLGAVPIIP